MKTRQLTNKTLGLSILIAFLIGGSQISSAQEIEKEVEIIEESDSNKKQKVIKGKRIKLIIATNEDGNDEAKEIVIDLPPTLTEQDAKNLESALEEAGEAMEEALENASEALEEALDAAAESVAEAEDNEKKVMKRHIVIDGEDVVELSKKKKPKLVETSWNVMELGLNELLTPNGADLPAEYAGMKIIPAKSINFHWGIVQQGINIGGGKLRLLYGLGIDFNNYRFEEDIDLVKGSNPLEYTVNDERNYKKNKLVSQYLTMPLMLNFKSNPQNENKSLNIAAGVHGGYLIQSHQKQKWHEDGSKEKRKIRGDYNFNQYRLGYALQFGYGDVNIYARYYPDPTFKDKKGPEVNTAAVGIVIMPF